MHFSNPGSFDRFFVGGGEDGKGADGIFDELRIYSGMLDDAELQRIFHETNVPRLHLESRYFLPYTEQQSLHFSASPDADWKLVDFRKRTLLSGKTGSGNIDIPLPPLEPGNYTLSVRSRGVENSETLIFFSPSTSFSKSGKLDLEKIIYVEVRDHTLIYHTEDEEIQAKGRSSMKEVEAVIAPYGFFRCSNCAIVNLKWVDGVKDGLCMAGKKTIPVSRTRKKEFMNVLVQYINGGTA